MHYRQTSLGAESQIGGDSAGMDRQTTPRGSRMGLAAFAIVLLLTSIALPVVASASEIRSGTSVDIQANERITEDLYSAVGSITISGTVTRDASITAGRARIDGTIDGSVMLAAGRADVPGTIGGSLRIAGGVVEVGGDIDGDLVVLGGRVTVPSGGSVGGDVIVAGGIVDLQGDIASDVRGIAMSATIAGVVGGDVDIESSRVSVPNTARIGGNLRYLTAGNPDISSAADILGTTERVAQMPWEPSIGDSSRPFGPLLRTVWALIAGVVIIALAPRLADAIGRSGRAVLRAIAVGLLALIVVPVVTGILIISTIGVPIGLIFLGSFVALLYLSQVFAGLAIGRFVLPDRWNDGTRGYHFLAMTIGVIILAVLNFIPLPFASAGIAVIVTMWGVGAALMVLAETGSTLPPTG